MRERVEAALAAAQQQRQQQRFEEMLKTQAEKQDAAMGTLQKHLQTLTGHLRATKQAVASLTTALDGEKEQRATIEAELRQQLLDATEQHSTEMQKLKADSAALQEAALQKISQLGQRVDTVEARAKEHLQTAQAQWGAQLATANAAAAAAAADHSREISQLKTDHQLELRRVEGSANERLSALSSQVEVVKEVSSSSCADIAKQIHSFQDLSASEREKLMATVEEEIQKLDKALSSKVNSVQEYAQGKVSSLAASMASVEDNSKGVSNTLSEISAQLTQLKESTASTTSALSNNVAGVEERSLEAAAQVAGFSDKLNALKDHGAAVEAELARVKADHLSKLREEANSNESSIKNIQDTLEDFCSSRNSEVHELEAGVEELRKELRTGLAEVQSSQQKQLAQFKATLNESSVKPLQIVKEVMHHQDKQTKQLNSLQGAFQQLGQDFANTKKTATSTENSVEGLYQMLAQLNGQLASLQQQIDLR